MLYHPLYFLYTYHPSKHHTNKDTSLSLCHFTLSTLSFSTGNLETLGGVREEKESEGEKGEEDANKPPPAPATAAAAGKLSARDECIAFHKKYYSANIMKVTIYGSEDLDTLQKWAEDKFSKIENKAVQPSAYAIPSDPYPSTQLAQLIKVVPVKDVKVLQVCANC